jgi:hypothetical protein
MSPRAAQVRFYVDADILGLCKIIGSLRSDVTYPGDPGAVIHKRHRAPCPIARPAVLDTDWIPDVAARGWLITRRDSMIIQNRNEIAAIRENNAKIVALNQRDAQTKWGQLEVLMTQRRHIEALTAERGPFISRLTRPRWRRDLDRAVQRADTPHERDYRTLDPEMSARAPGPHPCLEPEPSIADLALLQKHPGQHPALRFHARGGAAETAARTGRS